VETLMGIRVSYRDGEQHLEGYLAAPAAARNRPSVLVVPSWLNINESICSRADRLAAAGYVVFVADLFGAGIRPCPPQSPLDVVSAFLNDRLHFRRRLVAALSTLQRRQECDGARIAAVGYCIGGCGCSLASHTSLH
jgi:dienelactone hydrolase